MEINQLAHFMKVPVYLRTYKNPAEDPSDRTVAMKIIATLTIIVVFLVLDGSAENDTNLDAHKNVPQFFSQFNPSQLLRPFTDIWAQLTGPALLRPSYILEKLNEKLKAHASNPNAAIHGFGHAEAQNYPFSYRKI